MSFAVVSKSHARYDLHGAGWLNGLNEACGEADAIGVQESDPREAARRPTAFEAAAPGGSRSGESGSGDCLDEGPTQGHRLRPPRTEAKTKPTENTNAADPLRIQRHCFAALAPR